MLCDCYVIKTFLRLKPSGRKNDKDDNNSGGSHRLLSICSGPGTVLYSTLTTENPPTALLIILTKTKTQRLRMTEVKQLGYLWYSVFCAHFLVGLISSSWDAVAATAPVVARHYLIYFVYEGERDSRSPGQGNGLPRDV